MRSPCLVSMTTDHEYGYENGYNFIVVSIFYECLKNDDERFECI